MSSLAPISFPAEAESIWPCFIRTPILLAGRSFFTQLVRGRAGMKTVSKTRCCRQKCLLGCLLPFLFLLLACPPVEARVRRRLTIRSDPPGALVYIDDQEIGITPVSTSFTFYGTRKIQLIKDGYEMVTVKRTFRAPWYQITPIDFFTENLLSRELRDERVLDFKLAPQRIRSDAELRQRGIQLRRRAEEGVVAPPRGATTRLGPGPVQRNILLPPTRVAPALPAPGTPTFPRR